MIALWMMMLASAALAGGASPASRYSLSVGRVYGAKAGETEFVFIVGGTSAVRGGETVCLNYATLKSALKSLPRGSALDWWPTCHGESQALADHLDDLKKVCAEAGIVLRIHPAG